MRIGAWIGAIVLGAMLTACGSLNPSTQPGGDGPTGGLPGSPGTGTATSAVVEVELRGQDELTFDLGARVVLERFVINFGGIRLLRDLADPSASPIDLSGRRLPLLGPEQEDAINRFIIGADTIADGLRGIKIEFSPEMEQTSPTDGKHHTIFVQGVYSMPLYLDSKGDGAKISPNPAPIEPIQTSSQSLTSVARLPFTFHSQRVEDLLVGFAGELEAGRTVTVVFWSNRWFTENVLGLLKNETTTRLRLGLPSTTVFEIGGEGFQTGNEASDAIGLSLENNILETIGLEVH